MSMLLSAFLSLSLLLGDTSLFHDDPFLKLMRMVVKDNQPTLHDHLATYFADPLASFEEAETIDLQRGRKEVRHIKATSALSDYLQRDWPGVAQVAQLTRTVTT